ncbi:aromatic acid exporter family protein [Anaerosporobacter sp.]|uniref:aromatic acid exporter family protein n=1 Tax=Anaerosporobacter sp. TaxID=1872529 RepID=UPI00286EF5F1|nr:aromatic acid exporter family protein [Anaerosporobacter sp.]
MNELNLKLGLRTIKSAIAVFVCIIISYLFKNRDAIFFSGVAAIVCMQQTHKESFKTGMYRFLGTFIGGIIGFFVIIIGTFFSKYSNLIDVFVISIGVLLLIYLCNMLRFHLSVSISCIVFLKIVSQYGGVTDSVGALLYVFERVAFTLVGVLVAFLVNKYIFPYTQEQEEEKENETIDIMQFVKNYKIGFDYRIGMRAVKTVLCIFVCLIIAYITKDREVIFFASVAAVSCMQQTHEETFKVGRHTFWGTVLGGVLGVVVVTICVAIPNCPDIIQMALMALSVLFIIYFCHVVRLKAGTVIACIILLKYVSHYGDLTNVSGMIPYLINPILLYTLVGNIVALLVNRFVFPFCTEDSVDELEEDF